MVDEDLKSVIPFVDVFPLSTRGSWLSLQIILSYSNERMSDDDDDKDNDDNVYIWLSL